MREALLICGSCHTAPLSWRDCDRHPETECFATECDSQEGWLLGCGAVSRDCEEAQ